MANDAKSIPAGSSITLKIVSSVTLSVNIAVSGKRSGTIHLKMYPREMISLSLFRRDMNGAVNWYIIAGAKKIMLFITPRFPRSILIRIKIRSMKVKFDAIVIDRLTYRL